MLAGGKFMLEESTNWTRRYCTRGKCGANIRWHAQCLTQSTLLAGAPRFLRIASTQNAACGSASVSALTSVSLPQQTKNRDYANSVARSKDDGGLYPRWLRGHRSKRRSSCGDALCCPIPTDHNRRSSIRAARGQKTGSGQPGRFPQDAGQLREARNCSVHPFPRRRDSVSLERN